MTRPFFLWRIFIKITGLWYAAELRARYTLFTLRLAVRIGLLWLRWKLSEALVRPFRSSLQKTPQTELTAEKPVRTVRLYFYETDDVAADGPMAVVRYTAYNELEEVLAVQQLSYLDDEEGFQDLERDVQDALNNCLDVIIYTDREPTAFPVIKDYLEV